VQAESATHADGLARVATRLEALGAEAEGTRALLAALQGAGRAPAPPASPWEEALRGVTPEAGRAEGANSSAMPAALQGAALAHAVPSASSQSCVMWPGRHGGGDMVRSCWRSLPPLFQTDCACCTLAHRARQQGHRPCHTHRVCLG